MTEALQREYMFVNPRDIVIDMPVSQANVQAKVESIRQVGVIQPVTLWLQDLRVIDGFHRTAAARELGLPTIPAIVVDCSEEAFWDARIQSAKQHHDIANDRLAEWIYQSWRHSEFAESKEVEDFFRFIWNNRLEDWRALDTPAAEWFAAKVKYWGTMDWRDVARHILRISGVLLDLPGNSIRDIVPDLSLEQARVASHAFAPTLSPHRRPSEDEVAGYLSEVGAPDPVTASDWLERRRKEERKAREAEMMKQSRLRWEQQQAFERTEAGKAAVRKKQLDGMESDAIRLQDVLDVHWSIPIPEAMTESVGVREEIERVVLGMRTFLAQVGDEITDTALLSEVVGLRAENKELKRTVEAQREALALSVQKKAKKALALSSTDIEHMPTTQEAT